MNAAGIPQANLLMKMDYEEVDRILESNLTLTIAACKAATRSLMRSAPDCQFHRLSPYSFAFSGRALQGTIKSDSHSLHN